MTSDVHIFSFIQVQLSDFDSSSNCLTIPDTLNTITHGRPDFTSSPRHSCSCKRGGYSPFFDPYTWRIPEEPEDCSRAELARAYRIQRVPKGGF
jgi:hypothetical protein